MDYFNRKHVDVRWLDRVASDEPQAVEMNIYQFYHIVSEKLRLLLQEKFSLDNRQARVPVSDFDLALREVLVNCLVHADYMQVFPSIRIEAYDNFFSFLNPGKMMVSIASYAAGGQSFPRNEQLMSLFRYLGLSERQGFGGAQIYKSAFENKFRLPEIETTLEHTKVKIWQVTLMEANPDILPDESLVLELLLKNKTAMSKRELEEATGLNDYRMRKAIDGLVNNRQIQAVGKARATKYMVKYDLPSLIPNSMWILID